MLKAKGGSTMYRVVENDGVNAENYKIMICNTVIHILTNIFNFNKSLLMLTRVVFLHKTRNRHS